MGAFLPLEERRREKRAGGGVGVVDACVRGRTACVSLGKVRYLFALITTHRVPILHTSSPLACSRQVPCPTQRTHAIGLWAAQHSILEEGSSL
jgi:hypothetical protein